MLWAILDLRSLTPLDFHVDLETQMLERFYETFLHTCSTPVQNISAIKVFVHFVIHQHIFFVHIYDCKLQDRLWL